MAIIGNDSEKKRCRLSNAKTIQIDSFQTYRRVMWHLTIAVWSFRAGAKTITIGRDPSEHENGKDEKGWENASFYSPLHPRFKEFRGSGFKRPNLSGIAIAYYIHVLYRSRWYSIRDFLCWMYRLFLSFFFHFLPSPIVRDEKPLFATAEWFYDFVLHFNRFVNHTNFRGSFSDPFIYSLYTKCLRHRCPCKQSITFTFWTKSKIVHWANEQRTNNERNQCIVQYFYVLCMAITADILNLDQIWPNANVREMNAKETNK